MSEVRPSVCPLDCPDTCSLSVTVEDDRVVQVRGSKANPYTGGVICNKVATYYPEWVHGEGRLTRPLRRVGARGEGRFEPIGWDEALDLVHERISAVVAQHGPQAVMPLNYAGPHGLLTYGSMDLRFFNRLGATQLARTPLCGGVRSEAWAGTYGGVPGMPPEQAAESDLIVAWGNNVTWCNLHLTPIINTVKRNGGRLVVVDPRTTKIAEQAYMHVALKPGTDVVLAWGVTAELERLGGLDAQFIAEHVHGFEPYMERVRRYTAEEAARHCGVPAEQIRELARLYHEAQRPAISVGNGLERNQNGGAGIRAIFALPALAGKLGRRGAGCTNAAGNAFPKTPAKLHRTDFLPEGTRTLNIVDAAAHVLDDSLQPPLKALFIYNHNPLVVHPDQNRMRRALEREDVFTVGIEVVMTDSMAYCDVVLPACSHFEYADIYPAYGQQWLQRAEPVIPPVGHALPNTEIFRRLAARFGFDDPAFRASDAELMDDAVNGEDPRLQGVRPSAIPLERPIPMRYEGEEPVLYHNVFPKTPTGKVELDSSYLADKYGAALPEWQPFENGYPLALVSPASDKRITSTFGGLKASAEAHPLEMHPEDAAARGLSDGMRVRVWNDLGEVHLALKVTEAVRPGVVCSLKGTWLHTSDNGQTVAALVPGHHADICGGACYNDARVEVAALDAV